MNTGRSDTGLTARQTALLMEAADALEWCVTRIRKLDLPEGEKERQAFIVFMSGMKAVVEELQRLCAK